MKVRKNVLRLTAGERAEYVRGVKLLADAEKYYWYVNAHCEAMNHDWHPTDGPSTAHMGPAFLPWHRQFIVRLERELQDALGNPHFALPYWDWAADQSLPDPGTASVWKDDFMGGNGDADGIVRHGPFQEDHWIAYNYVEPNLVPGPLARRFGQSKPTLPTPSDVLTALSISVYDTAPWNRTSEVSFRNQLEGFHPPAFEDVGLHNRVHAWVGGNMNNVYSSPSDPVFFLHHCNTDRLWAKWQTIYPTKSFVPTGEDKIVGQNLNDPMWPWDGTDSPKVTPNDVLDYKGKLDYCFDTEITRSNGQLIQSNFGTKGNFEIVVPAGDNKIEHWWRNNDDESHPWSRTATITGSGYDTAVMIQSTLGRDTNFEVVARKGSHLEHWWRDDSKPDQPWYSNGSFYNEAAGVPSFIQGNVGIPGNFEVLTATSNGGVRHLWRDNSNFKWIDDTSFANGRPIDAVCGLYSTFGNLEAVTVSSQGTLQHWWRNAQTMQWIEGDVIASGGVSGPVAIIQNSDGHFEVVARTGSGLSHWWRDLNFKWYSNGKIIDGNFDSLGLIQSNFGNALELTAYSDVLFSGTYFCHYFRDDTGVWRLTATINVKGAEEAEPTPV